MLSTNPHLVVQVCSCWEWHVAHVLLLVSALPHALCTVCRYAGSCSHAVLMLLLARRSGPHPLSVVYMHAGACAT
jgi:hypothetical protein